MQCERGCSDSRPFEMVRQGISVSVEAIPRKLTSAKLRPPSPNRNNNNNNNGDEAKSSSQRNSLSGPLSLSREREHSSSTRLGRKL